MQDLRNDSAIKGTRNWKKEIYSGMAMLEAIEMIGGRFRGCMAGSLMGDCLGAPFEGEPRTTCTLLNSYFKKLSDPDLKVPYKQYTDDTAMTRCVAQSFIDMKGFDPKDMARKFVKEYYRDPKRGYGSNVVDVFAALRSSKFRDVYSPASLQFNGRGSYGNGAAMRVAPIALFCHAVEEKVVIDMARDMALLTHANRLGYNGAVLQCLAVYEALHTPENKLDTVKFIESLILKMKKVEMPTDDDILGQGEEPYVYVKRLEKVLEMMMHGDSLSREKVEEELGVYISAHMSVPTAIYSFIRASNPIAEIETENEFQRTLQFAISLGGDTDTIASMAGSIAGAYYGIAKIPNNLKRHCEALTEAVQQADQLLNVSIHKPISSDTD